MKKVIIIILSCLVLCGVFLMYNVNKKCSYEDFLKDYQNIAENFYVKGFQKTGDGENTYSGTTFPENAYFPEKDNIVDDDLSKPARKNIYFINKDKSILIYISHMYSYEKLETHMITSDIPQSEYGKSLPYFEEYYMTYNNTFVNLKIFSLKDSKISVDTSNRIVQSYIKILRK